MSGQGKSNSVLVKLSKFVIKFRYVFFTLFLILTTASVFGIRLVKVNNNTASYLPPESETRQALDIMAKEFESNGSTEVMIKETTVEKTNELIEQIYTIDHVSTIKFDETKNYIDGCSLLTISLDCNSESNEAKKAVNDIRTILKDQKIALRGSLAKSVMFSQTMTSEMIIILAIAVVVILTVLTLTSKSFFEIPIFLVTFVVAAILNMGTNFLLGSISFITNSVAVILQLALAIDYAIIIAHRYAEESFDKNPKDAVISTLANSIPSILASSLTTISGLIALMFMQFRIGFDIGIVLTKGILCSFITVFFLMPGLLYCFSGLINKTRHKNFIPSPHKIADKVLKARKIIPIIGLVFIIGGAIGQSFVKYTYNSEVYQTSKTTQFTRNVKEIDNVFGEEAQMLGILVDKNNYEKEKEVTDYINLNFGQENGGIVQSVMSFGAITGGLDPYIDYTPSQANTLINNIISFASKNGLISSSVDNTDFTASLKQAYFAYNVKYNNSPAFDLNNLYLPLFDSDNKVGVLSFIVDDLSKTYPIDETTVFLINTLRNSLPAISSQLVGTSHSRIIIYCVPGIKSESTESFSLVKDLRNGLKENNFYDKTLVFGDMVSYYDIAQSFSNYRFLVNLLTIVFILTILLLSFRSLVLPIILLTVIQGAIWINFSIYAITLTPMLFMSYLIVSAISMGATIDYAIVVTNRYRELRSQNVAPLEAGISAISNSFSAILTSSTIMIVAGFVIAFVSTEPYIFTIGMVLGSGTIISLLMVIFLLPSLLIDFDKLINVTTLKKRKNKK